MHHRSVGSLTASVMVALVVILMSFGCSGGKGGAPTMPGEMSAQATGSTGSGRVLWGFFQISIDPSTGNCEVTPLRGAMFNCNVVKFLQPPSSPIQLVTVNVNPDSDFTTGYLDLDVTLRHPFPGLDKFRGFDVRGIVMGGGSVPFNFDQTVFRAGPADLVMENPDGWTRWWNPTEFTTFNTILGYTKGSKAPPNYLATATINPYKFFADDLDKDSPLSDIVPANRGTFSVISVTNKRRYILQFPPIPGGVDYRFNYAVDASWALPSDDYAPEYPVEAYPPEANAQEAGHVSLSDEGSTAWYVNDQAKGGYVHLDVEVYDWQGAGNPSGVEGEVASIFLDCPLFNGPVELTGLATVSPAGEVSSVWSADIADLNLMSAGTFDCWIAVQADDPENYAPQIQGDPGAFAWPDAPLRAYAYGTIEVSPFFPSNAPEVLAVVPNQGVQSTVVSDLQVLGVGFQSGATVEFFNDTGDDLVVSGLVWQNDGLITCDLDCAGPLGLYDVKVKNQDTQEGTLEDGFEVIKPPEDSIWWKSHMYNIANIGRNPTVPGADPEALTLQWMSPVSGDKKYTTPVVVEDKIYFTGNDGFYANTSETMYCYDLYSGGELWKKPINPSGTAVNRAFACPAWWEGPDGIKRVAVGGDQVYCYDAITGEQLWYFDDVSGGFNASWVSNQMQEYDGMVLARTRNGGLYVLDFITGSLVSKVETTSPSEGGCGAKDGKVYISSARYLDCADILTGQILWTTPLPNDAEITHWINPTIVGTRCYFSTYQGYVFCVAIENDGGHVPGEIIWSWNDPNITPGNNPLVGGTATVTVGGAVRLFVAAAFSGNYVYCIEDKGETGETLWLSDSTGYYDASPVWSSAPSYPGGVVYCPNRDGYLDAFDASTGHNIWHLNTGTELRAGMTPILDMLVVTSGTDVAVFKAP